MAKQNKIVPELRRELARRFKDRNQPGYWGVNARAWLRLHIKAIRAGKPYGHLSYINGENISQIPGKIIPITY